MLFAFVNKMAVGYGRRGGWGVNGGVEIVGGGSRAWEGFGVVGVV